MIIYYNNLFLENNIIYKEDKFKLLISFKMYVNVAKYSANAF